jgi:divalent metal cation (Fe/Co/Zn/Cd) transporter
MKNGDIAEVDLAKGQRTALFASAVTFGLAVAKALIGYGFHSPLLVADGFHTFSDFTVIFASWFGLFLAARKKTERFPYGLYKAETLVSFVIGLLVTWAGIEVFLEGVRKFGPPASQAPFPDCRWGFPASPWSSCTSLRAGKARRKRDQFPVTQDNSPGLLPQYCRVLRGPRGYRDRLVFHTLCGGSLLVIISLLILKLGLETIWFSLLILLDANLDRSLQSEIVQEIGYIQG